MTHLPISRSPRSRPLLLLLLLPLLLSCRFLPGGDGIFRDRQGDYLTAPVLAQMRVPEDLDSYTLDELYVIPEEVILGRESFVGDAPRPRPMDTNRPEGVVIRRFSGENWMVIAATPGQVWPRIRDFWLQEGIALDYENPVDGIVETAWLDPGDGAGLRDKYRMRIEPGLHAGSSDVVIIHISRQDSAIGRELVLWPNISESEDKEFEMLQRISQYMADRTDIYSSSAASLLAGSLEVERKARLTDDRGAGSTLELRVSENRAWGQVGQALDNAAIEVLNRDRDMLAFDVLFSGQEGNEEEPGFFSRLLGRAEEAEKRPFQVRLARASEAIVVTAVPQFPDEQGEDLASSLLQMVLDNLR